MRDESGGVPSKYVLLEQCREKIGRGLRAYWPEVTRKIANLNRARRARGARAVNQADIEHAIRTGSTSQGGISVGSDGSWSITINGVDTLGEGLVVMVDLSSDKDDLLLIRDFVLPH